MSEISTIGLDTAKQVFQVEGRDAAGNVVLRRQLRRGGVVRDRAPGCTAHGRPPGPPRVFSHQARGRRHCRQTKPTVRTIIFRSRRRDHVSM
jgi:transposase